MILASGPGTDARAAFARAGGWLDTLRAVAAEPDSVARRGLIVFPQVGVLGYRADLMVVCADVRTVGKGSPLSHMAFFVECDGPG